MLEIGLRILSVLGILLLVLLGAAVAVILLVLFFPITYRISGEKDEEGLRVNARANWLCGLLGVKWQYPNPGNLTVRLLIFTLFDSEAAGKKNRKKGRKKKKPGKSAGEKDSVEKAAKKTISGSAPADAGANGQETSAERENGEDVSRKNMDSGGKEIADVGSNGSGETADGCGNGNKEAESETQDGKISRKISRIRYTIRGICDKIKEIWDNIIYYIELLQEEDSRLLFDHALLRLKKVMKALRPGHIRADILFGTGSPDTTGYFYGAYCMVSPALGGDFSVTPDFEQAVFQAEFDVSGHITLWVFMVNGLKLLLDKKLHKFIRKLRAGRKTSP